MGKPFWLKRLEGQLEVSSSSYTRLAPGPFVPKRRAKAAMGANKVQKSKEAKMIAAMAGAKSKQKKWSKGKVKEKLSNAAMFDKTTFDQMLKEIPKAKLITPSVVSERLKVNGSAARGAIKHLEEKGYICHVGDNQHAQIIHTRKISGHE